jgi:hypothetical protein
MLDMFGCILELFLWISYQILDAYMKFGMIHSGLREAFEAENSSMFHDFNEKAENAISSNKNIENPQFCSFQVPFSI